jgi:hypothetical protein
LQRGVRIESPRRMGPCVRRDDARGFKLSSNHKTQLPQNTASRSRRAFRASFAVKVLPSQIRGRRECRAPSAPRSRVCSVESTRVSHHGHTGITRHSPRNGFTAYFVLSPVTGLSCHRRLAEIPAKLDASVGASGPHDFAVRIKRCSSLSASASTASRPALMTLRNAPLWDGTVSDILLIWGKREVKFFCK